MASPGIEPAASVGAAEWVLSDAVRPPWLDSEMQRRATTDADDLDQFGLSLVEDEETDFVIEEMHVTPPSPLAGSPMHQKKERSLSTSSISETPSFGLSSRARRLSIDPDKAATISSSPIVAAADQPPSWLATMQSSLLAAADIDEVDYAALLHTQDIVGTDALGDVDDDEDISEVVPAVPPPAPWVAPRNVRRSSIDAARLDSDSDDSHTTESKLPEQRGLMAVNGADYQPHSATSPLSRKDSPRKTAARLVFSILGIGVIGIPFALREAGLFLGLVLLSVVAYMSDASIGLVVHLVELARTPTFADAVRFALGAHAHTTFSLFSILFRLLLMSGYSIVLADTISSVVRAWTSLSPARGAVLAVVIFFIIVPATLLRFTRLLRWQALVWTVAIACMSLAVLIQGTRLALPPTDGAWAFAGAHVVQGTAIMLCAFHARHDALTAYRSMARPNKLQFARATHAGVGIVLAVAVQLGVAGYCAFTGNVSPNVLNGFADEDAAAITARILLATAVMFTFPVDLDLVGEVVMEHSGRQSSAVRMLVLVAVAIIPCLVGALCDALHVALAITGAVPGCVLAFVFPGLCYLRVGPGRIWTRHKAPSIALVAVGALMPFLTLVMLAIA